MTDLFRYPHEAARGRRSTSAAAADHITPRVHLLRERALGIIESSNGLTADEVAGRLGESILSIRPRCTELARLGRIRDSGERRHNASGRSAIVWSAVYPARIDGQRVA